MPLFKHPCARQCDNNFAAFTLGPLQTQSVFVRVQTHCEKPISVKSRSLGAVDRPLGPSGTQGPICSTECVILSQQACHSSNHSNTHSFLESGLSGQSSPFRCWDIQRGFSLWFTDTEEYAQGDIHKCDFWALWGIKESLLFSGKCFFHSHNCKLQTQPSFSPWRQIIHFKNKENNPRKNLIHSS